MYLHSLTQPYSIPSYCLGGALRGIVHRTYPDRSGGLGGVRFGLALLDLLDAGDRAGRAGGCEHPCPLVPRAGGVANRVDTRVRHDKIGRASCRERVCQYVLISVVAVALKKKTKQ